MFKKVITIFLITSMFISSVYAGNFNVKLDKIYPSGDKMLISFNEGKNSALLVLVKEEGKPAVLLTKIFKPGSSYPCYYSNPTNTEVMVYDDNGDAHKFLDDTNSKIQAENDAKAAVISKNQADNEFVGAMILLVLVVVIIAALASVASTPAAP